jgi:hypothetical protein
MACMGMGMAVDEAAGLQDELGLEIEQPQLEPDGILVRVDEPLDPEMEMVELFESPRADVVERGRIVDPPALPEGRPGPGPRRQ